MKHMETFFSGTPAALASSKAACAVPPVARRSSWISTTSSGDRIPSYITRLSPYLYSKSKVTVCTLPGSLLGLRSITNPQSRASANKAPRTKPLASMPKILVGFMLRFFISVTNKSFNSCNDLLSANTGPKSLN